MTFKRNVKKALATLQISHSFLPAIASRYDADTVKVVPMKTTDNWKASQCVNETRSGKQFIMWAGTSPS